MNNKIIPLFVIVGVVAVMAVCYMVFKPKPVKVDPASSAPGSELIPEDYGKHTGDKSVKIEVTNLAGETVAYEASTNADYLTNLMAEVAADTEFEFTGSEGDYGFFIESINGEVGDYNVDGTYWAIYVNGEYGMYGADQQVVNDGDTFTFVHEGSADVTDGGETEVTEESSGEEPAETTEAKDEKKDDAA